MKPPRLSPFGVWGPRQGSPQPTLLVIGGGIAPTLTGKDSNRIRHLLAPRGYLSVALDIPCHGTAVRPGEQEGLPGMRARLEAGDDFTASFTAEVRAVVDELHPPASV